MNRKNRISFLHLHIFSIPSFAGNFNIVEDNLVRTPTQDIKNTNKCIQKTFFILIALGKYN